MGDVISLKPDDQENCSRVLDEFKPVVADGKISSLVIIGVNKDGQVFYSRDLYRSDRMLMIGSLQALVTKLCNELETERL